MKLDWNPKQGQLTGFARAWVVVFGGGAAWFGWFNNQEQIGVILGFLAAALPIAGLLYTPSTKFIYRVVSVLTYPLGWLLSHVILCIIYFGIMTPIGVVAKLFGHAFITKGKDKNKTSYWEKIKRPDVASSYFKQF